MMAAERSEPLTVARQRATILFTTGLAVPITLGVWLALRYVLPPVPGATDTLWRLAFALKWSALAVLLCFVPGIEAIARERLVSDAIDPLAQRESMRLRVNLRYLQHTLEQLLLFIPGLLALSWYSATPDSLRAVSATAIVWILTRWVFWIGYHIGPRFRGPGLIGMVQSIVVLLYVAARFGDELAGPAGAVAPIAVFFGIEVYLTIMAGRRSAKASVERAIQRRDAKSSSS